MRFGRTNSRHQQSIRIVNTIAWAIAHKTPIALVLRSLLPPSHRSLVYRFMSFPLLGGLLSPLFRSESSYFSAIQGCITDLNAGRSLPDALERRMRHLLPPGFLLGVRLAYDSGKQEELIPVLAQGVEDMERRFRMPARLTLLYVAGLAWTAFIVSGLLYFIVPRFERMAHDLGDVASMDSGFLEHSSWLKGVGGLLVPLLLLLVVKLVLSWVFSTHHSHYNWLHSATDWFRGVQDSLIGDIPFFGRRVRLQQNVIAAQAMYACLIAGLPVHDAARETSRMVPSPTVRRRWRRFAEMHESGMDLAESVKRARISEPFTQWLILAGLERGQLANGFLLQANTLSGRLKHHGKWMVKLTSLCLMLVLAWIVGASAVSFFRILIQLTDLTIG